MLKKTLRIFLTLLGGAIGVGIGSLLLQFSLPFAPEALSKPYIAPIIYSIFGIILAALSFLRYEQTLELLHKIGDGFISASRRASIKDLTLGTAGLLASLLIAYLVSRLFDFIPNAALRGTLSVLSYIIFAYCGVRLTIARQDDLMRFFAGKTPESEEKEEEAQSAASSKLLDTSVIIDGRIFDVCQTGFVEGKIVVPNFVLKELQFIADCPDTLKRGRGRRGLELIGKFRENYDVEIADDDFTETDAVDDKLVLLAKKRGCAIITNDYNLNQVARVQGIRVLNVNDLANALKPALIPGETLEVQLIKEGKEPGQAVGYLADGTMVVVDDAVSRVGQMVCAEVTSMLQTSAGRMIFAKLA